MTAEKIAALWPYKPDELARSGYATGLTYVLRVASTNGGTVTEDLTFDANGSSMVAGRHYWVSGDDQVDGSSYTGVGDLVRMLEYCLNRNSAGITYTVTRNLFGGIQVSCSVGTAKILWSHANTTLGAEAFGFAQATDYPTPAALALFTSPNLAGGQWLPSKGLALNNPDEVSFTSIAEAPSGVWRGAQHADPLGVKDIGIGRIARANGPIEFAAATAPYNTFGHLFRALKTGKPMRLYPDDTSFGTTTYTVYRLAEEGQRNPLVRENNRIRYAVPKLSLVRVSA